MIAGYCPVGNYSFEIIYKKYHTFFVHYAEKTMGEELYAEDVVQDVFINLLQQTNYFVSEGAVLKYIYKALYNRCIDPEISEKLGLSIRTVENQIYIARNVLREYVDSYLCS